MKIISLFSDHGFIPIFVTSPEIPGLLLSSLEIQGLLLSLIERYKGVVRGMLGSWRGKKDKSDRSDHLDDEKQVEVSPNEGEKEQTTDEDPVESQLQQLDPEAAEILRSQIKTTMPNVGLFSIIRFSNKFDKFVLCLAVFFAIVHGVSLPCVSFINGAVINAFRCLRSGECTQTSFMSRVQHLALYYLYLGIGTIGSSVFESYLFEDRGEVITGRWRQNFLRSLIGQNIAFFDKLGIGQLTTSITNDTTSIQETFHHAASMIQGLSAFIAAIIISLCLQWKVALILLSAVFANFCAMVICGAMIVKFQGLSGALFVRGTTIAEEAFSAIRTTVSFGAAEKLTKKFDSALAAALRPALSSTISQSVMLAALWSIILFTYALGFWEGSRIIAWDKGHNTGLVGHIFAVILATLIGSFQLGTVAPSLRYLIQGTAAAKTLMQVIDRQPMIDAESDEGEVIPVDQLEGHVTLSNIKFRYPSRPDIEVLEDFSLDIPAGKTVALVGPSGGGKSTIVGLLERFYCPIAGSIMLDGKPLDQLNVRWLRQQIGYVQQEPTLFATSIFENIAFGLIGSEWEDAPENVKREKVVSACKDANAYDFIQELTDGLDTNVGHRGFLLSGGQKQRICIARAIVSNPPILLLDEATSALDSKSEDIVQDALDRVSVNRTTITIAHRLSTIKNAAKIVVISRGKIVEQGTHSELLDLGGMYSNLVMAQKVAAKVEQHEEVERSDETGDIVYEDKLDPADDTTTSSINREDEKAVPTNVYPSGSEKSRTLISAEDIPGIKPPSDSSFRRYISLYWKLNRPERLYLILGGCAAVVMAYCFPSLGMITGNLVQSLIESGASQTGNYGPMRHEVNVLTAWFFFVGCIIFIAAITVVYTLTYASDRLVRTIRLQLFRHILHLDIAFFDYPVNTPGALMSTLAKDSKAIEGLGGATLGQIFQSIIMLLSGIITSIPWSWRIALVATATTPVLLLCGFLRVWVISGLESRMQKVYESSGNLASTYVGAIRTVQSLTRERKVVAEYSGKIDTQVSQSHYGLISSAILYGFSQGLTPWVNALVFWWGSYLLSRDPPQASIKSNIISFMAIILGAQSAGSMFSYSPNLTKAFKASQNIYRLLKAQPCIDSWSTEGISPSVKGHIEFKDVQFRYPTRPEVPVLRGVNLKAKPGQYIALVGPSGCGKSTSVGLIERFYDVNGGSVLIDGRDIREYNIKSLRSHISLVEQEPILYSGTIRENIAIGWAGNDSDLTDEMIEQAAREANIHDYVMSLPSGYDTISGYGSTSLLSGGQKQRVAIARALVNQPSILILDESTAALDSESETIVQKALDNAAKGRTTVSIAHRLSSIQNADVIYVFDDGRIVEYGDHQSLLAQNGRYAELVSLQALGQ